MNEEQRDQAVSILRAVPSVLPGEPVAIRHSWDGRGWQYIDCGSGSDWLARGMTHPDAEPLYV